MYFVFRKCALCEAVEKLKIKLSRAKHYIRLCGLNKNFVIIATSFAASNLFEGYIRVVRHNV